MTRKKKELKFQMMDNLIYIFLAAFILIGCESSLKNKMTGVWKIEQLNYKNENYIDSLYINVISFNNDNIYLPDTKGYKGEEKTEWGIIENLNGDSLIIKSNNDIFNGRHELLFAQDSDGSIFAKLISKEAIILIHKSNLGLDLD